MDRPNILVFMTDHQRGDSVLPEHPAVTPNLTKFVQQGITFSETFCPSPHCCPARATFHSGLYPSRSGVWNNVANAQALTTGLKEGVRLWSEDLFQAGYRMEWLGKWHVSIDEDPKDRGWHEILARGIKGTKRKKSSWEYYREIGQRPEDTERGKGEVLRPGWGKYRLYGSKREARPDDTKIETDIRLTEEAVNIMPELASGNDPWTLFIGMSGPHDSYMVPQEYIDLYSIDDIELPVNYIDEMMDKPRIYQRLRRQIWGQLTEKEVCDGIRHFWAYCSFLDDQFGKVLKALDKEGQAENTLVLYCSDHGDYCGDHGLFCKGIPAFRGAYHVPAVVRWPAGIQDPDTRVDELVSLADFAPTFLELAGIESDREFSGMSLVPFLKGETPPVWREELFMQCNGVELYYTQRIVMTKEYKYVFNGFDLDELYDLKSDPHEIKNLVQDPSYEDIKRALVGRMWRCAYREKDGAINSYITVGLAPYGPAEAFRK